MTAATTTTTNGSGLGASNEGLERPAEAIRLMAWGKSRNGAEAGNSYLGLMVGNDGMDTRMHALGLEGRSANFLPIFCIGKFCETS